MEQGRAAASSSRAGSESRAAGARPRTPAVSPSVREGGRKNPPREPNCSDPWCKSACDGSKACKPCGRALSLLKSRPNLK